MTPCKKSDHKLCFIDKPDIDTKTYLGSIKWEQCPGCLWWVPKITELAKMVHNEIDHGAAPAIATNQTIRELMEKEEIPHG